MTVIPEKEVTLDDLTQWKHAEDQLNYWKATEMMLRKRCANAFFHEPIEGSRNKFDLANGYKLELTHVIFRNVDEALLDSNKSELEEADIDIGKLIKYKPSLVIASYRALPDEKRNIFDQCLIIKDGSPQLKIIEPKGKNET